MKYISYETIDGDTKNIDVTALTEAQITLEIACLQLVGDSGTEPPLRNIALHLDN